MLSYAICAAVMYFMALIMVRVLGKWLWENWAF